MATDDASREIGTAAGTVNMEAAGGGAGGEKKRTPSDTAGDLFWLDGESCAL